MRACRETRRLMQRAFDGRITVDEEFRLEEHTQTCAKCAREYDESRALTEALLAMPAAPVERLDLDRSLAAIHAGIDRRQNTPSPVRLWGGLAAAAALLACLGYGIWSIARQVPDSTETAAVIVDTDSELTNARVASAPESTDFDITRHQNALQEVRAILVRADGAEDIAASVDALATELVEDGWPLVRLIERFVIDEDLAVAQVATRYLGYRGDGASAAALASVLARPSLEVPATHALVDLGALGLDELATAVWNPALTSIVIDGVRELDGRVAAAWIERTLERARIRGGSQADALVAARLLPLLANCELVGAETLLRLTRHPWLDREAVLDELARTPGAADLVDDEWLADRSEFATEVLLGATQRLHGEDSLGPVVELCKRSRRHRGHALAVLATYDGVGPVHSMLTLGNSARMPEDVFLPAWRAAIDHDAERMHVLASKWPEDGDAFEALNFLHWLVVSERAAAVPAILELADSPVLLAGDRERALFSVSEFGGPEHLSGVADLFIGLTGRETKIAAACIYAAHALGGEEAVTRLLSEASTRTLDDVARILAQPGATRRPGTTLFRLARELEPVLKARDDDLSRTFQ